MLICGALLFIAPWALDFSTDMKVACAAWIGGAVVAVMAIAALVQFFEWEDWIALVAGVLIIIAPWALGFAAMTHVMWTFVVLGLIIALASLSEIWMVHRPTTLSP
jgi:hypothetical protein